MKTIKILLLLLILFPLNKAFPQYFIDQNKIVQAKDSSGYYAKPDYVIGKRIYLLSIFKTDGYTSDVKIGFDKEEYKSGDIIIITASLPAGSKLEIDKERVAIGSQVVFLTPGESKEIKIPIGETTSKLAGINVSIGIHFPYRYEDRSYTILLNQDNQKYMKNDSIESIQLDDTPMEEVHPIHHNKHE